jgi:NADPH:quinone reductase-like Zn-dependent oxidoreductase
MKAIAAPDYGPLEALTTIDLPLPSPGRGEVRVRVAASALNPADYKVILGEVKFLHGRQRPLTMGYDFSGTIDEVGADAGGFAIGDDVFGFLPYSLGNQRGAFAEAVVASALAIAKKPGSVSHLIAAASATTGLTAIQALRDLGKLPGEGAKIAVTGVSGGVGSIAIGVAQRLGAEVSAIGSGKGLELAKKLGAREVFDRTERRIPEDVPGPFHVVFDAAAAYRWSQWRHALAPGGAFVSTLPSGALLVDKLRTLLSSTRAHFVNVKSRAADLALLAGWLEAGLEVPLADTIAVRDVANGLVRLRKGGGRIAVRVADGFAP